METPTKEQFIDDLVERRRRTGSWTDGELASYRESLVERYEPFSERQFRAAMGARAKQVRDSLK